MVGAGRRHLARLPEPLCGGGERALWDWVFAGRGQWLAAPLARGEAALGVSGEDRNWTRRVWRGRGAPRGRTRAARSRFRHARRRLVRFPVNPPVRARGPDAMSLAVGWLRAVSCFWARFAPGHWEMPAFVDDVPCLALGNDLGAQNEDDPEEECFPTKKLRVGSWFWSCPRFVQPGAPGSAVKIK